MVVPFLSQAFIRELFVADDANIPEIMLFRIALELDAGMQREMIRHVRLPLIPAKAIMDVVLPSGFVSKDACLEALPSKRTLAALICQNRPKRKEGSREM